MITLNCFHRFVQGWALSALVVSLGADAETVSDALQRELAQVHGPVYDIEEPDLRELLSLHALQNSDTLAQRQSALKQRLEAYADAPRALSLPRNQKKRDFERTFDPVPQTLVAANFERHWLFIDARYPSDIALAKNYLASYQAHGYNARTVRVILTGGRIEATQRQLNTRVWFDQSGSLTHRLGIEATPALADLNREKLRVTLLPAGQERI